MSQERSKGVLFGTSLLLGALAFGGGLVAMAHTQGLLVRTLSLRWVLIVSELALAAPALLAGLLLSRWIPELYRFRGLVPRGALTTVGIGLAFWGLSLGVFEAQYVLVKPPLAYLEQFQGLHQMLKPSGLLGWIFSIAAIAVAPAVCEEILFRGLLAPVLRRAAGSAFAIVFSAALFSAIHVDALADGTAIYYRVPFAFVLGLLLARLRFDTESLWPPMIAHATLNATTFVVVLLMEEPSGTLPDPQPFVALGMVLVGSVAARALMRRVSPAASSA